VQLFGSDFLHDCLFLVVIRKMSNKVPGVLLSIDLESCGMNLYVFLSVTKIMLFSGFSKFWGNFFQTFLGCPKILAISDFADRDRRIYSILTAFLASLIASFSM
jgi:hypothetical protein